MTSSSSYAGKTQFQIEELCSKFEGEWIATSNPGAGIGHLLEQISDENKPALIHELIAVELELRRKHGQVPREEDYVALFPSFAKQIERAFQWMQSEEFRPKLPEHAVPKRIGDFRITREIGRGGMGIVYEAIQESLNRRVAIKTFSPRIPTPDLRARFEREVKAIGSLRHTNIVEVYGTGQDGDDSYFAMQLIDGLSIKQKIAALKVESVSISATARAHQPFVAKVGIQIASALAFAHENGIVHRDIKPSNLLLDKDETVHVSDFGLAKLADDQGDLTQTGEVIGSLRYLAPEVILKNQYDQRSDIFSFGLTLYELLTLRPAYDGSGHSQILHQASMAQIVRPKKHVPAVHRDFESIIMKCVAKDPADRYQQVNEVREDIELYLGGHPIKATRANSMRRTWKWAKRNPALATLFTVLFLVTTVGFPTLVFLNRNAIAASRLADTKRYEAELAQLDAKKREYGSLIQLAGKFVEDGLANEVAPLLDQCLPTDGEPDLRDWEWYFVKSQLDSSRLTLRGHSGWVHQVVICPDGKQIASVGGTDLSKQLNPGEVILWNTETGEQQHLIPGDPSGVSGAAFHPDGKELAVISFHNLYSDGRESPPANAEPSFINVWEPESGKLIRSIERVGAQAYPKTWITGEFPRPLLPGLQYSQDGTSILTWPKPVQLFDATTGELRWQCNGGHQAAFLDSDTIVILHRNAVEYVSALTGELIKRFPATSMQTLTPTGKRSVTAIARNRIFQWQPTGGMLSFEPAIKLAPSISWGAFNNDLSQIAFGNGEGTVKLVTSSSETAASVLLGHRGKVTSGAFSNDGELLVTGARDGSLKIWGNESRSKSVLNTGLAGRIGEFAFSNKNRIVFAANSKGKYSGAEFPQAGIFEALGDSASFTRPRTTFAIHAARNDFAYSSDGRLLAAPLQESELKDSFLGFATSRAVGIWDSESGWQRESLDVDLDEIICLAWRGDDRALAVGGIVDEQPKLLLFKKKSESEEKFELISSHDLSKTLSSDDLVGVAFSNNPDQLAIANRKRIELIDLKSGESMTLYESTQPDGRISFLEFSSDGRQLAVAFYRERVIRVFETASKQLSYTATAPRNPCCVRFSPNRKRLAIVGHDSRVYFCDAATGYRLLTLNGCDQANGGFHITSRIRFSPDGTRIANNNHLGQIIVWSVEEEAMRVPNVRE